MTHAEPDALQLRQMLIAARKRTLVLSENLAGERELGPELPIVNPPLWEFGHLAWFQEHWCLRHRPGRVPGPSMLEAADALYNSATVSHASRWHLPLPDFSATLGYLARVLEAVMERLDREGAGAHLAYFVQLAALHEEMHCEAFTYTRQTLAYPAPRFAAHATLPDSPCAGDAEIAGGWFDLGARSDDGFVFDNEKWAHPVELQPYRMARRAVTYGDFADFVAADGYRRRDYWSTEGWAWRVAACAEAPAYWVRSGADWRVRVYDQLQPLPMEASMLHANWHEAQAYCRWAGRRLPTEAEWEFAASTAPGATDCKRRYPWGHDLPDLKRANLFGGSMAPADADACGAGDSAWGVRQMIGNVWEWTADTFAPYPGFVRDPYAEYSEPWFGNHKVLRGGCFATRDTLIRNTWRNFYTPDRRDVFAGFRTCAT